MSNKNYIDVFCRNTPEPVYCYRSGLAVYEERFLNDTLVAGGWNASGYPLNVLFNCPSFINYKDMVDPVVFHIELDGQCVDYMLEIKDYKTVEQENGGKEVILTLKSRIKPVEIEVHTLLDGTPVLSRWLEIKNMSEKPMALSRLSVFSGALQQMENIHEMNPDGFADEIYEMGYFESDEWGTEGDLVWKPLPRNKTSIEGRFTRQRYRHPVFFLRNKLNGEIFFGQIAWSGGYEINIENIVNKFRSDAMVTLELAITGFKPLRVIDAGESYVSPQVIIGSVFGTTDDAVNAMYDHIRKSVLNMPEANGDACLVGSGMGPEQDMSVETTKRFVDQLAYCGVEIFIVDAGWYCPPGLEMQEWHNRTGYWYPDKDRYPSGIEEIRDYVHSKGMKFAMWMESERVGLNAPCFEEHPDWYVKLPFSEFGRGFLDFTNPEAAAWAEEEIARVITEYKLDLFRIDHNVGSNHYFYFNNAEIPEGGAIRHFEAVYAMYQRLKKRFPDVIFENCASGGGRTDLGMLKAFNHTWVTDWQKAPRSLYITNGMTYVLPPERVDRLVGGMGSHPYASLDFQMRNTMFGHMTLNVFSPAAANWNEQQLDFIRHSVKLYKDFIRPMLPTSRMYHHTKDIPTAREQGNLVMELASFERDKAVIGIFKLPNAETSAITVFPRGIDFSKDYKVTFDNNGDTMTVTGRELSSKGITTLPLGTMTSELILIETIK